MNTYVKAMDDSQGYGTWIPKVYCVLTLIVGNFTLLALFTGILMQQFSTQTSENLSEED